MKSLNFIIVCLIILTVSSISWGEDFTINSKVYTSGANILDKFIQMDPALQFPDHYGSEIKNKVKPVAHQKLTVETRPQYSSHFKSSLEEDQGLVSNFINSYLETSSRL